MESNFLQADILSNEDVEYLKQVYERYPKEFWVRDYNLFNIHKCDLSKRIIREDVSIIKSINDKIKQYVNHKNDAALYFLKYTTNSFTSLHIDNPNRIKRTAVTLLDVSSDLIGGDAIIVKDVTSEDLTVGNSRPDDRIQNIKVPVVVRQRVGSTLMYNHNVKHGVTKVEQGYRLVLISWFN